MSGRWRAAVVCVCLWPAVVSAQFDSGAERERIARERAAAELAYARQQRVCAERFFVTACLDQAREDRRQVVDGLRREALRLDTDERRRQAAQRLELIRQKTEAERRREEGAAARLPDAKTSVPAPPRPGG
jgi:colicin import membrane protein